MIILKIIGIVAAALVLLILLLLPAPIDLVLRRDEKKGFRYYIRICGIPIKIDSGKKKEKKKPKKQSKLTALIKRAFGVRHVEEKPAETGGQAASPALQETFSMAVGMAEDVLNVVRKCKIVRCRVRAISAGEDAALDYGTTCAVVYPLAGWLRGNLRMSRRAMDIQLGWDYERPKAVYEVYFTLRIRVLRVLITLAKALKLESA